MAEAARATSAADDILALLPSEPWADRTRRALAATGIAAVVGETDPWASLGSANEVHATGNDEFALLALLAGVAVHCHTDGAITGRGLTIDDPVVAAKPRQTLERLAAALLVDPVYYRDPFTGGPATAEDAIARLAFWRRLIDANRGITAGAGIAAWKRREVAGMLWAGDARPLRFFQRAAPAVAAAVEAGGTVAVWPSRTPAGLEHAAVVAGVPIARVEDGFVRSVGLGSACHPPLSIVLDRQGIYYDPARASDLETILATAQFPAELTRRAERLAAFIVRAGHLQIFQRPRRACRRP